MCTQSKRLVSPSTLRQFIVNPLMPCHSHLFPFASPSPPVILPGSAPGSVLCPPQSCSAPFLLYSFSSSIIVINTLDQVPASVSAFGVGSVFWPLQNCATDYDSSKENWHNLNGLKVSLSPLCALYMLGNLAV